MTSVRVDVARPGSRAVPAAAIDVPGRRRHVGRRVRRRPARVGRRSSPRSGADDVDDVADPDAVRRRRRRRGSPTSSGCGWRRSGRAPATSSRTTGCGSAPIDLVGAADRRAHPARPRPARVPAAARAVARHVLRRPALGERREARRPGRRRDDGAARADGLRRRARSSRSSSTAACCRARSPPASTTSSAWLVAAAWFAADPLPPGRVPRACSCSASSPAPACCVTGRLGMSIATHVAFNVTGLLLAAAVTRRSGRS